MDQGESLFAVKRSATGLGLFAVKRIPKGKKIVEYTGPRIPNDQVEKSNGKYFFGVNKRWSIDGSGRDNIARYINHSCAPNAEAIINRDRVWIWSKKTIQPGEEIEHEGLRFVVDKVERRRLLRVRLELPEKQVETNAKETADAAR